MKPNGVEEFWAKVDRSNLSGCWIWLRGKDGDGYGMFSWKNKTTKAHRFSYELEYGEIPEGMIIRHNCDNTSCVNPKHLVLGTHADNAKDRETRGRGIKGRKQTPEHIAKKARSRRGKKWTEEMKLRAAANRLKKQLSI